MRALIVDDEPPARRKLRRLLEESGVTVCGEADCGEEAIALITRQRPDLVLLDISMPDMSGFHVLEHLAIPQTFHVIFVTAHDDRALAAFDAQALDYLVKPVQPERFHRAIARWKRLAHAFPTQIQAGTEVISVARIRWAESARNYVVVHADGSHIVRTTLDALEAKLDSEQFARVSRSHIVNLRAMRELTPAGHGERKIVMRDGTEILWTRRYREALEAYLSRIASR
jgi:two-component system LytT family response regulator